MTANANIIPLLTLSFTVTITGTASVLKSNEISITVTPRRITAMVTRTTASRLRTSHLATVPENYQFPMETDISIDHRKTLFQPTAKLISSSSKRLISTTTKIPFLDWTPSMKSEIASSVWNRNTNTISNKCIRRMFMDQNLLQSVKKIICYCPNPPLPLLPWMLLIFALRTRSKLLAADILVWCLFCLNVAWFVSSCFHVRLSVPLKTPNLWNFLPWSVFYSFPIILCHICAQLNAHPKKLPHDTC